MRSALVNMRKQGVTISRVYRTEPDECARALELLLKAFVSKGGGPVTAPDDRKGLEIDPARTQHTR